MIYAVAMVIAIARCWSRIPGAAGDRSPAAIEQLRQDMHPILARTQQRAHALIGLWLGVVSGFSAVAVIGYLLVVELILWIGPRLLPGPSTIRPEYLGRVLVGLPFLLAGVILGGLARAYLARV